MTNTIHDQTTQTMWLTATHKLATGLTNRVLHNVYTTRAATLYNMYDTVHYQWEDEVTATLSINQYHNQQRTTESKGGLLHISSSTACWRSVMKSIIRCFNWWLRSNLDILYFSSQIDNRSIIWFSFDFLRCHCLMMEILLCSHRTDRVYGVYICQLIYLISRRHTPINICSIRRGGDKSSRSLRQMKTFFIFDNTASRYNN